MRRTRQFVCAARAQFCDVSSSVRRRRAYDPSKLKLTVTIVNKAEGRWLGVGQSPRFRSPSYEAVVGSRSLKLSFQLIDVEPLASLSQYTPSATTSIIGSQPRLDIGVNSKGTTCII